MSSARTGGPCSSAGSSAILFGVLAIAWPGETLLILITLFGAYAFVDGIFSIVAAVRSAARHAHWAALLLEGILGVIVGLITFFHPGITALVLLYFIAAWAIITGILELIAAIRLRKELAGEVLLILSGLASVIFGILLAIFPSTGVLTVVWLIGVYAIVFGVLLIGLSFRLKSWHESGGIGGGRQTAAGPA